MKNLICILLLLGSTFVNAQTTLLEEEVTLEDSAKVGPNKKRFGHTYFAIGVPFGNSESDSVGLKVIDSYDFMFGYRFKYRLTNFYSIGFGLAFDLKSYSIKQDSNKIFPNTTLHEWERLSLKNLSGDVYNRFNFGRRGNHVGKFLDLGAYANWVFASSFKIFDKHSITNSVGASNTKQVHKGLVYLNDVNYGLLARVGFNKFVFYGTYRMSDIFRSEYIFTELPRFTAGLQISIHK